MESESQIRLNDYLTMTVGSLIMSVGIYFFKIPYGFSTGGISGIGTLLGKVSKVLTASDWILILNCAVLLVGFVFLGKEVGGRTVYCTLLLSVANKVFEHYIPMTKPFTDEPLMELIIAMILTSFGSALIFFAHGSSGGTDIIALIIQNKTTLDVGNALLVVDCFVAVSSFFVFDMKIGLLSMLGLVIHSFLIDSVLESLYSNKVFFIITDKADIIEDYIINSLKRSATVFDGEGAYTKERKKVVQTVVRRKEAVFFQRKIKELDPNSFTIITKSIRVIGRNWSSE